MKYSFYMTITDIILSDKPCYTILYKFLLSQGDRALSHIRNCSHNLYSETKLSWMSGKRAINPKKQKKHSPFFLLFLFSKEEISYVFIVNLAIYYCNS